MAGLVRRACLQDQRIDLCPCLQPRRWWRTLYHDFLCLAYRKRCNRLRCQTRKTDVTDRDQSSASSPQGNAILSQNLRVHAFAQPPCTLGCHGRSGPRPVIKHVHHPRRKGIKRLTCSFILILAQFGFILSPLCRQILYILLISVSVFYIQQFLQYEILRHYSFGPGGFHHCLRGSQQQGR